ncbi:MAG: AsmA-like C-terminal domain-containing protein, partial [Candidatus Rokubacteria bacterium]|nr:AsmA-like C-terminal domain-containing protein [Candidatus Rokubacteria bacterium]
MRGRGWLASVLIVLLLLGTLAAGLLYLRSQRAGDQIRAYLESTLSRELAMPVRLGGVGFSLRLGEVEVRQAALLDPETRAPLLETEQLRVRLALWPLLRRELRVRSVSARHPRLLLEDSPRLRELAHALLARLGELARAEAGARFPLSVEGALVRYTHAGAGVAVDIEALGLDLRWQGSAQATATLVGESRLRLGSRTLDGIRLEASARAMRHRWEVTRLQLARGGSALALHGTVATSGETPRAELDLGGTILLEELAPFLGLGADWTGAVVVNGKLLGDRLPPVFQGTVKLGESVVKGLAISDAEASLSIHPDVIEIASLEARAAGGRVWAAGIYEPGAARYRGRVGLNGVSLDEALGALGWSAPLTGRLTGSVEGSGQGRTAEGLSARLDLSARRLRAKDGSREIDAALVGQVAGSVLRIERLALVRKGSRAAARGSADLASGALALTVSGTIDDLGQGLWPWAVEGIGGRLSFSGQVGRTLKAPRFSGQVRGQELSLSAARLTSVEGPLEVEPQRVSSRGLKVATGSSLAVLAGEAKLPPRGEAGRWREALSLSLKVDGRGRLEDLAGWLPRAVPLAGPFALRLTASGTPKSLAGGGQLEVREVRVGTERLESIRAALGFEGSKLTIRSLTGSRRGIPFRAEGQLDLSGTYRFTLAPVKLDLATLSGAPALTGTVVLRARGAGDLSQPHVEGDLALTDTAFRDLRLGSGTVWFSLEQEWWKWQLALDTGAQARGTAPLTLAGPLQAEVIGKDLDLSPYLRALRRRLPFPLAVRADGSATLSAQLPDFQELRARVELTALRCRAGETPCRLRAPTTVTAEGSTLRFDALDLVGPGLSVTVNGSVQVGERTDLELRGYAPFALLESWVPAVSDVKGTPEVRVSLTGAPGALRVAGRADLRGVEIRLKPLPVALSVSSGEVSFANERVEYAVWEGAAAGGRLEGRGASERRGARWHHALELGLDKARLEQLYDELQIRSRWASGDLRLRGSLGFETGPEPAPLRTLAGSLSARLEGGSLSRYPALVRIFGLLGSPAQPVRLPDLAQERMPYRRISADFTVAQGVMETKNLVLDSEVVRVSGVGKVRLPEQTLDFDLAVRLLQVLEGGIRKLPVLGRLLPQEQSLAVVYFDVAGPWNDPKTSVAPVKSLS